jgi:dihydrofolate reductase
MNNKTILYIAMSEDGFIAGDNDNLDFLNNFQVKDEDYGYSKFMNSVEFIVVGRKTYDKVISMGYPYHKDKQVFVITRVPKESPQNETLTFYNGAIAALIGQLKASSGNKHIYCDGGAALANHMIDLNLIDQMILSVVPTKLNRGTLLFKKGCVPNHFELKDALTFKSGLIQYTYLNKNLKD